jgi:hypothetical protein
MSKIQIKLKPTPITSTSSTSPTKKYGICIFEDCPKHASFGLIGTKDALYCAKHRGENMIDIKHKSCQHDGCPSIPSYGYKGTKTAMYCVSHKEVDMINVISKKCQYQDCTIRPTYGYQGTKTAIYCTNHRENGMIDVVNKTCQFEKCSTRPKYGIVGTKIALYCAKHKQKDMVDVNAKTCQYQGCIKHPTYGYEGTKIRLYCAFHREEGMINVLNNRCQFIGCSTQSSYGYQGTKIALYCVEHKESDMVNVISKACQFEGCLIQSTYGYKDTKTALYCVSHKGKDMVNVRHKTCQFPDCLTGAYYGLAGHQVIHCAQHKQVGEKIHPRAKCQIHECKNLALYGYTQALHCEQHRVSDEYDLVQKECVICRSPEILDEQGRCSTCNPEMFRRVRLAKQKKVRDFLNYNDMTFTSYDRMIDHGACGRERPDFIFDVNTHMICLEVDEDQHITYKCDEMPRMINISQSLGMPTLFIRFNPDKYRPITGQRRLSDQKRLEALKNQIDYWSHNPLPTDGFCFATYLFYDDDDPVKWKTLKKLI